MDREHCHLAFDRLACLRPCSWPQMEGTEIQILGLSPLRDVSTLGAVITVSDGLLGMTEVGHGVFIHLFINPVHFIHLESMLPSGRTG